MLMLLLWQLHPESRGSSGLLCLAARPGLGALPATRPVRVCVCRTRGPAGVVTYHGDSAPCVVSHDEESLGLFFFSNPWDAAVCCWCGNETTSNSVFSFSAFLLIG